MKDARTQVSAGRGLYLLLRLHARRWRNRMGQGRWLWSKANQTNAKPRPNRVLLFVLAGFVMLQVVSSTARLVARIAHDAELRAVEPVFVSAFTYVVLSETATAAGVADAEQDSERLRGLFDFEASQLSDPLLSAARRQAIVHTFAQQGPGGFRVYADVAELPWPSVDSWFHERPSTMFGPLALITGLVSCVALLHSLVASGRDLADAGARAEWLFSFPVPERALFFSQALSGLLNPLFAVVAWPYFSVLYWCAGFGAWGLVLGLGATAYLALLCGAARVAVETTLRKYLGVVGISRIQAVLYLVSSVTMMGTLGLLYAPDARRLVGLSRTLSGFEFTPLGLPIWVVAGPRGALGAFLLGGLVVGAALSVATRWSQRMVRVGIVAEPSRFVGQRGNGRATSPSSVGLLSGLLLKEWRALYRDRQVRTQALVAPGLLILSQHLVNPHFAQMVTDSPRAVATASFSLGAFVLIGASTALAGEAPTLWLLGTFPKRLDEVLLRKLSFWALLACAYATMALGASCVAQPQLLWSCLPYLPVIWAGIWVYAVIAIALGALGTDLDEPEPNRRVGMSTVYQHLGLITLFAVALYVEGAWTKLVELVLSSLLAYALWQKLRDRLPYLVDPSEQPVPALSVVDGTFAAFAFFVLQSAFGALASQWFESTQVALLAAFTAAGIAVAGLSVWRLRRSGIRDLLASVGLRSPVGLAAQVRALSWGVAAGAAAAVLAIFYLAVVGNVPSLVRLLDLEDGDSVFDPSAPSSLLPLVVLAAPVFEEFIFRGLLFNGFRRSWGLIPSVLASSAVFAIVHPPAAALPVFGLAVFGALTFERTKWLASPVVAHMVYNALLSASAYWANG